MSLIPHKAPTVSPLYPDCIPLHTHCILTVSSLYPNCILTVSLLYPYCITTVPSLYTYCTLTVPPLYPYYNLTVPPLYAHCTPIVPHCTPTVLSLYPTVSLLYLTVPQLYPHCILTVPPLYPHCTPTVSLLILPLLEPYNNVRINKTKYLPLSRCLTNISWIFRKNCWPTYFYTVTQNWRNLILFATMFTTSIYGLRIISKVTSNPGSNHRPNYHNTAFKHFPIL